MPKTRMLAKGLAAPESATPKRAVKLAPEGIVTAIVAVTGVEDAVQDLIVPGAFAYSLSIRRPKVVDDHEWGHKAGRVLHVEEWMPGDRRLPKQTKDGKPWPAAAGALVATMQYNLRSERGRESYEWVRFYAESNEAEFSIGYKVPDGKARLRRDGVRVILMVDLFEFSHVLFGAAPLSMALDVKSAGISSASGGRVSVPVLAPDDEDQDPRTKTIERDNLSDDDDSDEDDMLEAYDTPPKFDPESTWDDDPPIAPARTREARAPYEAKTAAAVVLEGKSKGGADKNRGNAERLRRYWVHGAGAAKIAWGTPGDFNRCVAELTDDGHMTPEQAKGYCNLRHHDALGYYPATHAAMEGKTANAPQEVKAMSRMKGSYEERIAALHEACRDLLDKTVDNLVDVCPVATYDHEVVVTAYPNGDSPRSYLIGYKVGADGDADDVELGEPQPVELSLVAEPAGDDKDDPEPDGDPDDVETVTVVGPMLSALDRAASIANTEGKAAAAVRDAATRLFGDLSGKSAKPKETDPEDQADGGADEAAEDEVQPGDNHITADTLPHGDWNQYRKTQPIHAMPMDSDFTVQTREGVVKGNAGDHLAVDSEGYPYPIAKDEMSAVYTKANPADPEDAVDGGADEAAEGDDVEDFTPLEAGQDPEEAAADLNNEPGDYPDDGDGPDQETPAENQREKSNPADPEDAADGGADEAAEGDGRVTLNPDEHFANMDALDAEDPEDAADGGADEAEEDDAKKKK